MGRSTSPPDAIAHPRPPQTPPPGPGFAERLDGTEIWTDRFGQAHRLGEMSDDYLWAVLGYLRWYAPQVRDLVEPAESAEGVPLMLWLTSQPIWRAVACELVRRRLIRLPTEAMARLMASGPVPWETGDGGPVVGQR